MQRVSLTTEEHDALEPNFDINERIVTQGGEIRITTSRGCFEGCSFCAASNVFRSRHVGWSLEKKMAVIRRAHAWLRSRGITGNGPISFNDDNFFHDLRLGIEFLRAFREDPLASEIQLLPQLNFGSLFRPDGSFAEEVPNLMLRPDGTPFVHKINVGVDYWSQVERPRNKGGRQGKLTNEQIRTAVAAFTEKKIAVHAYWMLGDEQTTLTSFSQGLLFLAEMLLDHGPYFMADMPEPVELRTGTPIRDRVLAAMPELPEKYIRVANWVGDGEHAVPIYEAMFPRPHVIPMTIALMERMNMMMGRMTPSSGLAFSPHEFLALIVGLTGKWRTEVLSGKEREVLGRYLKFRRRGRDQANILGHNQFFRQLPTDFSFFSHDLHFNIEDLLELAEIESRIPNYYKPGENSLEMEQRRRNPDYSAQLQRLSDQGILRIGFKE